MKLTLKIFFVLLTDNVFVVFSRQVLPTISRYTHGHKLCSSFGWLIFILICSRIYSKACARKKEKLVVDFNSIFLVCPKIFLQNIWPFFLKYTHTCERNCDCDFWAIEIDERKTYLHWHILFFTRKNSQKQKQITYGYQ